MHDRIIINPLKVLMLIFLPIKNTYSDYDGGDIIELDSNGLVQKYHYNV